MQKEPKLVPKQITSHMASGMRAVGSIFNLGVRTFEHPLFKRTVILGLSELALLHFTLSPSGKFYVVRRRFGKPFVVRRTFLRIPFVDTVLDTILDAPVTVTHDATIVSNDVLAHVTIALTAQYNPPHRSTIWLSNFHSGETLKDVICDAVFDRSFDPHSVIEQDTIGLRNQLIASIKRQLDETAVDVISTCITIEFKHLQDDNFEEVDEGDNIGI